MTDFQLFSPRTNDFCVRNSRLLGELSLAAYETSEIKLGSDLAQLAITDCRLIENRQTDTQALVARGDQAILVAFRGTEASKLTDLLTDVDLELVPGPLGQVHRGFWEALESIWDD